MSPSDHGWRSAQFRCSEPQSDPDGRPVIPNCELLRCIGHGAYGEVWLARNLTGSDFAVKVVYRRAFDHDRPFEREFEGIQRFEPISRSHPSQLAIHHVGRSEDGSCFYYVMDLADAAERKVESGSELRVEGGRTRAADSQLRMKSKTAGAINIPPLAGLGLSQGSHAFLTTKRAKVIWCDGIGDLVASPTGRTGCHCPSAA